ncbi:protein-disulfide reductase DsbD domain-containing protein [Mucilaginibacter sp. CSA2-8R]|uniref:protein-disulfide reductase DsbD domain-containing protein n=1 Tax=Mucilaginibacter sp. CSA2-8R TaxID=3141542 RepID=UPI00315D3B93
MKKLILILVLMCAGATLRAQILTPVKWAYAGKRISKTEAVILIKATMDDGWHLYSQNTTEGGPVKTTITFTPDAKYKMIGKTIEPKAITEFEKAFNMNVSFFEHSVVFQQKIKMSTAGPLTVKGTVEYMTCNDQKCLPPDQLSFTVTIK